MPKHLHDALTAARLAQAFLGDLDGEAYGANALVRSAVERQQEIRGEASRRLLDAAPDLRDRMPELSLAVGPRDRLIPGYDRIVDAVVIATVRRDLPRLQAALQAELARFPQP